MSNKQILSRVFLIVLAIISLPQCGGGKNKANGAEIKIVPPTPIVITADVTIGDKDIAGPWYSFKVEIDNQTEQAFEIVALEAVIYAVDDSGKTVEKESSWAPGEMDYTIDTLSCVYTTFGTWAVGEKKRLQGIPGHPNCNGGDVTFYDDDNQKGPNGKNFRYRVKLKPLGYFIDDLGDPADRFEKFKTFFTR